MAAEDSRSMLEGVRFPQDEEGHPAAMLVGLVDKRSGGHFVPVNINPENGRLGVAGSVGLTINEPVFYLMHDQITATEVMPTAPKQVLSGVGCTQLVIDVSIDEPGSYVKFTPITWNNVLNKYIKGETSPRIIDTQRFVINIHSPTDLYLLPIEVFGTISVAVAVI